MVDTSSAADVGVDPWARGGSMSQPNNQVQIVAPVRRPRPPSGDPPAPRRRRPSLTALGFAAGGMAVIAAALLAVPTLFDRSADERDQAQTTDEVDVAAVLTDLEPLPAVSASNGVDENVVARHDTSIGEVAWTKVVGDDSTLPARVIGSDLIGLVGEGESSDDLWLSLDDGSTWVRRASDSVGRSVGGERWQTRMVDGHRVLLRVIDGEVVVTDFGSDTGDAPDGFTAATELIGPSDGFPVELDGELYVLAISRWTVPWDEVATLGRRGAYRVRVRHGDESIALARGGYHEMLVEDMSLRALGDTGRYELLDPNGASVWSGELDPASPIRGLGGSSTSGWWSWNGERFEPVSAPWRESAHVSAAVVQSGGVLARSAGVGPPELWFTDDGRAWTSVELPAPTDRSITLHVEGDETILSILTDAGPTYWSTDDGLTFRRLGDVPDLSRRSHGSFGWVTPGARSSPLIRVSPDEHTWEAIDLSEMLDVDAARWDVTIDTRAVGDAIYVAVDRPDGRMLLIGHVTSGR